MIEIKDNIFKLSTENTSYIFSVTEMGHLEHIHYGSKIPDFNVEALRIKNNIMFGTTVAYNAEDAGYSLDTLPQEYSGIGKGDYRHSPSEIIMPDGSFVTDFIYDSFEKINGPVKSENELPFATGDGESLIIKLKDRKFGNITLTLSYTVFTECDVIVRNAKLENKSGSDIFIRKLMSFMMDINSSDYNMLTLNGGWAKEAHINEREISYGILVNDSTVGASSNRNNPAFMLKAKDANEYYGEVFGFNLIYSGNHYSAVEKSNQGTVRVMSGINPHCFLWKLKEGESFVTPEAVLSYSENGTNKLAQNMHDFVNSHIIRENFRNSERPIVINNWEATFFNFNRRKLLALARKAKTLGVEMFVLDDGWFGTRNSDTEGLGDWEVNLKKLPGGIKYLSEKINKMGMKFGLWFEPECVNEKSKLYEKHPDWAIKIEGRAPSYGRNQLTLDLTRKEVRDYIVNAVSKVLAAANISYVKWDYNRHISDMYSSSLKNQGEFFHRYILGLYEVLTRIFVEKFPHVLLESCSSGGNRFDLGVLCFSPQIWTSDDTDAYERLNIQRGMYLFYPPSSISNHVSMVPNQQTLRSAPLSARFNTAAFGVLGYELDFAELTSEELKEIKSEIAFYKAHRKTLQYGKLYTSISENGKREFREMHSGKETVAAVYNLIYEASPERDIFKIKSAEKAKLYSFESVEQRLKISRFGSLIKHVFPVNLKADGFILRTVNKHFSMVDGKESYKASGEALRSGVNLSMQYSGTGYEPSLRILGDFGSSMYLIKETEDE